MAYRTDLIYKDGKLAANNTAGADTRKPLPKVEKTDLLQSDAYGESWQREAGVDDAAIRALGNAQGALARTFKATLERRESQPPELTQAKHLGILASDFDSALSRLARQADDAQQVASNRLNQIESDFRTAIGWSEKDNQELRSVIRGMAPDERSAFIQQSIESGDGQALAAVLGVHPALTGIDADLQQAYRAQAMHKHRPDLLKVEKVIKKAKQATRDAFLQILERSDALTAKQLRDQYAAEAAAAAKKQAEAKRKDPAIWGL